MQSSNVSGTKKELAKTKSKLAEKTRVEQGYLDLLTKYSELENRIGKVIDAGAMTGDAKDFLVEI